MMGETNVVTRTSLSAFLSNRKEREGGNNRECGKKVEEKHQSELKKNNENSVKEMVRGLGEGRLKRKVWNAIIGPLQGEWTTNVSTLHYYFRLFVVSM